MGDVGDPGTTGYALPLTAVWHAAFPFTRSVMLAERTGGSADAMAQSQLAFATYALPLFHVGLVVAASGYLTVFALAVAGRTLYPRWAGIALPAVYVLIAFFVRPHAPVWADLVLGAGGWNLAGAALFGLSTAILWSSARANSVADASAR
jgi:hypothetical protein